MSTENLPKIEKARRQLIAATQALQQLQVDSPELILQMRERVEDRKFGIIVERWITSPIVATPYRSREVILLANPWAWHAYTSACEASAETPAVCKAMVDYLRTGYRSKP